MRGERVAAAQMAIYLLNKAEEGGFELGDYRRDAEEALTAADAVMFSDEQESWAAQIIASYGVADPFACAAEVIAALKGDAA